jgi:zinc protease
MNKLNRKKAPPIKDAVDYQLELKPYTRIDLTNEVPVYCIHAGAEEVIQIEWVFDAGNWYEKENLVASATNYLLKNGTSSHTAYRTGTDYQRRFPGRRTQYL